MQDAAREPLCFTANAVHADFRAAGDCIRRVAVQAHENIRGPVIGRAADGRVLAVCVIALAAQIIALQHPHLAASLFQICRDKHADITRHVAFAKSHALIHSPAVVFRVVAGVQEYSHALSSSVFSTRA